MNFTAASYFSSGTSSRRDSREAGNSLEMDGNEREKERGERRALTPIYKPYEIRKPTDRDVTRPVTLTNDIEAKVSRERVGVTKSLPGRHISGVYLIEARVHAANNQQLQAPLLLLDIDIGGLRNGSLVSHFYVHVIIAFTSPENKL